MLKQVIRALCLSLAIASPAFAEIVAFQARSNGQYVIEQGSGLLVASSPGGQALTLEIVRLDGNRVAFRDPSSGQYLRAGVGRDTNLMVASPHIRGWETFELMQNGPDVMLRAVQNGRYVGLDGHTARLRAAYDWPSAQTTFRMFPVSQPALPQPQPQAGRIPQANLPFAGVWVFEDIYGSGINSDRAIRQARLNIGARGEILGYSACNSFTAQLLETRSAFVVAQIETTRIGCGGAVGAVEGAVFALLDVAAHFGIGGNGMLEIRDWNGRLRARLTRD